MNSYTIINNSVITSSISNTAFRVYSFLEYMCFGKTDHCWPSQVYIAKKLHICVRTVQRAIKELKLAELIFIKRRGSVSNIYYVLKKVARGNVEQVKSRVKKVRDVIKKTSVFNNFTQRKYNFKNLENMLLGNEEYDSDQLIE